MSGRRCQFVVGGRDYPIGACDAPASIKRDGVWLCAEHYDHCEENAVVHIPQDPED